MSSMMVLLTLVLTILTTGVLVEWIGRSRHARRLFFLSIGRERNESDGARATRLRIANAIVTTLGVAVVLAPLGAGAKLLAVILCPIASTIWLTVEMVGAVRSVDLETIPGRFAVSLEDPPSWRDYVSMPLQLAIVLLVLVPSAAFACIVSRLPEQIPAQFDVNGNVSRMANPHELWSMGGMLVFDLLLMWTVIWAATKERWAMPEEGAERYFELQMERRRLMVRMIELVVTAVNVSMVIVWLAIPIAAFPGFEPVIGPAVIVTVILATVGALAPIGLFLPSMMKVQDEIRAIAGTEVLGTRPAGWIWGGTVYYAPEDPALFVPKRVGIGQTLNMARPSAWIFLIAVIVAPLAIALGAIALAS